MERESSVTDPSLIVCQVKAEEEGQFIPDQSLLF